MSVIGSLTEHYLQTAKYAELYIHWQAKHQTGNCMCHTGGQFGVLIQPPAKPGAC